MRPALAASVVVVALLAAQPVPAQPSALSQAVKKTRDGSMMVYVPAGEFTAGAHNNTTPGFRAKLDAYWIDMYEVTNAQFGKFVHETGYTPEGYWSRSKAAGKGTLPAIDVTWRDANAYARWAGKRLPTELEWERAARGTDGRIYPWGNNWDANRAVVGRDERTKVDAVGSHKGDLSPAGCYDMAGNASEWCLDHYAQDAYHRYAKGDMRVPMVDYIYCIRTCGAASSAITARCDTRLWATPGMRSCGFRCVVGPEPKLVPLDVDLGCEMNDKPLVYRTPSPPKKPKPGDVWICPKNKEEMVYVPAGKYKSGHNFKLTTASTGAFWMSRFPITVAQFREFVKSTHYKPVVYWRCYDVPGHEMHPALGIAYEDAEAYAKWMGQRLPKPNEWEKSARGTDGRSFSWGNKWNDDYAIPYYMGVFETVPIGTRPINRSPYGIWDMSGENYEWVNDPDIAQHHTNASAIYKVDVPPEDSNKSAGPKPITFTINPKPAQSGDKPGARQKKNTRSYRRLMCGYFAPLGESNHYQTAPSPPVFMQACKQPDGKTYQQPDNSPMDYTFRCVLDAK